MQNKKLILSTLITATLLSACSTKKNPVGDDLNDIRQNGQQTGNGTPTTSSTPPVVTKTVYVDREVPVVKEESSIDEKLIVINPDSQMVFSEGQTHSYNIRVKVLVPNVEADLLATDLPSGATLTASKKEKGLFILSWTPDFYTIPATDNYKYYTVKLEAKIAASSDKTAAAKIKNLVKDTSVTLSLFKNKELPSDLKIVGLPAEVSEDQVINFKVSAKVPGAFKNSALKPTLIIGYGKPTKSANEKVLEMDGSRYVIDNNKVECDDNSVCSYVLAFDTKSVAVEAQKDLNNKVLTDSTSTLTYFTLKIKSPNETYSPEIKKIVKINLTKKVNTARFDFSAPTPPTLTVNPGDTKRFGFKVTSIDKEAVVVVKVKNSALPGSPLIKCSSNEQNKNMQICQFSWTVPCDAQKEQLDGSIDMMAVTTNKAGNSENTFYSLKVAPAKSFKSTCNNDTHLAPATNQPTAPQSTAPVKAPASSDLSQENN